jgi:hypothetical protein
MVVKATLITLKRGRTFVLPVWSGVEQVVDTDGEADQVTRRDARRVGHIVLRAFRRNLQPGRADARGAATDRQFRLRISLRPWRQTALSAVALSAW